MTLDKARNCRTCMFANFPEDCIRCAVCLETEHLVNYKAANDG